MTEMVNRYPDIQIPEFTQMSGCKKWHLDTWILGIYWHLIVSTVVVLPRVASMCSKWSDLTWVYMVGLPPVTHSALLTVAHCILSVIRSELMTLNVIGQTESKSSAATEYWLFATHILPLSQTAKCNLREGKRLREFWSWWWEMAVSGKLIDKGGIHRRNKHQLVIDTHWWPELEWFYEWLIFRFRFYWLWKSVDSNSIQIFYNLVIY